MAVATYLQLDLTAGVCAFEPCSLPPPAAVAVAVGRRMWR